jgi:hypothetical protein
MGARGTILYIQKRNISSEASAVFVEEKGGITDSHAEFRAICPLCQRLVCAAAPEADPAIF